MVTIFDGIEKMTKEQLCYEVALFEHITISGYVKAAAGKAKQTSVRLANRVTGLFAKKQFTEPEALSLSGQIAISKESLMLKDEEELKSLLKGNLCGRLESLGVKDVAELPKERLSALIIMKAGEALEEVPDTAMLLRKAERIKTSGRSRRILKIRYCRQSWTRNCWHM